MEFKDLELNYIIRALCSSSVAPTSSLNIISLLKILSDCIKNVCGQVEGSLRVYSGSSSISIGFTGIGHCCHCYVSDISVSINSGGATARYLILDDFGNVIFWNSLNDPTFTFTHNGHYLIIGC